MSTKSEPVEKTQLTPASGYKTSRMIFSDPVAGSIPNSKPSIEFMRIFIKTKNADGTIGDLILPTERLFSFGIQQNVSQETGKVNGYSMPLCMWSKEDDPNASNEQREKEKEWVETFEAIIDKCKKHLIEVKKEVKQYTLEMSDLKKFAQCLYWKRHEGEIVEGVGPVLYTKLIESKKQGKILTMFYDKDDNEIPFSDLEGKYCHTSAAVKIESIFIGSKISLQVKLWEAEVELAGGKMERLRKTRPERQKLITNPVGSGVPMDNDGGDSDVDDASEFGSDTEEPVPPPKKPAVKKTVVKRNVKKTVKG